MSDSPNNKDNGLYQKFVVIRCDGKDEPGKKHENCFLFVLDPEHDERALSALRTYIEECRNTGYNALADDLENRLDKMSR